MEKTPVVSGISWGNAWNTAFQFRFFWNSKSSETQRVFWVNPSFSYSTLRKTNICILYCNYNQQQFYEYVNRLVVSICLNHFQQPWIFWWNHWHLRNLVPQPIFSEKSGSSTICPWDSSPIFFRSFSVFFSEEPDLFHHSSIGFCWGKPGIFHHSSDFLGAKPVFSHLPGEGC